MCHSDAANCSASVSCSTCDASPFSGDVVQLVRTLPCHGRGREFESRRPRHFFHALRRNRQKLSWSSLVQIKRSGPKNDSFFELSWSNFGPGIKQLPTSCPAPSVQPCSVPIVSPASPPVRTNRE